MSGVHSSSYCLNSRSRSSSWPPSRRGAFSSTQSSLAPHWSSEYQPCGTTSSWGSPACCRLSLLTQLASLASSWPSRCCPPASDDFSWSTQLSFSSSAVDDVTPWDRQSQVIRTGSWGCWAYSPTLPCSILTPHSASWSWPCVPQSEVWGWQPPHLLPLAIPSCASTFHRSLHTCFWRHPQIGCASTTSEVRYCAYVYPAQASSASRTSRGPSCPDHSPTEWHRCLPGV